jgi:hypothetical protein
VESDDGMEFKADTVRTSDIRKSANYQGVRVDLLGVLDHARCPIQIDVGFGDVVVPHPEDAIYPTVLSELPPPSLRVYSRYSVVAEKLEAMVSLGILNSRMKDFFDLWTLAQQADFDGPLLDEAIRATFQRRGTAMPIAVPLGLSDEFANDENKQKQWQGFLRKSALQSISLSTLIAGLRNFLVPVLHKENDVAMVWKAAIGWESKTR